MYITMLFFLHNCQKYIYRMRFSIWFRKFWTCISVFPFLIRNGSILVLFTSRGSQKNANIFYSANHFSWAAWAPASSSALTHQWREGIQMTHDAVSGIKNDLVLGEETKKCGELPYSTFISKLFIFLYFFRRTIHHQHPNRLMLRIILTKILSITTTQNHPDHPKPPRPPKTTRPPKPPLLLYELAQNRYNQTWQWPNTPTFRQATTTTTNHHNAQP